MASDRPDDAPEDTPKSAEDRKAASALANLNDEASPQSHGNVDQAAVSAAMKKLGGGKGGVNLPVRGNVKIDQGDVSLLVSLVLALLAPLYLLACGWLAEAVGADESRLTSWMFQRRRRRSCLRETRGMPSRR